MHSAFTARCFALRRPSVCEQAPVGVPVHACVHAHAHERVRHVTSPRTLQIQKLICLTVHATCVHAVLGQGKFAKVYKATHKSDGKVYAIKVFSLPVR
jgi:hypothetical protein